MGTSQTSQVSIRLPTYPLCQEQTEEAPRSRTAQAQQTGEGIDGISSQRLLTLPHGRRDRAKTLRGPLKRKGLGCKHTLAVKSLSWPEFIQNLCPLLVHSNFKKNMPICIDKRTETSMDSSQHRVKDVEEGSTSSVTKKSEAQGCRLTWKPANHSVAKIVHGRDGRGPLQDAPLLWPSGTRTSRTS